MRDRLIANSLPLKMLSSNSIEFRRNRLKCLRRYRTLMKRFFITLLAASVALMSFSYAIQSGDGMPTQPSAETNCEACKEAGKPCAAHAGKCANCKCGDKAKAAKCTKCASGKGKCEKCAAKAKKAVACTKCKTAGKMCAACAAKAKKAAAH